MGAKKGKKAHRKIDTTDVTDFIEKSTREERQGLVFEGVPDADLFFVDKGPDETSELAGAAPGGGDAKKGKKLTRAQAILQAAHNAKPVSAHMQRKHRGPLPLPRQKQPAAAADAGAAAVANGVGQKQQQQHKRGRGLPVFDLWAEEPQAVLATSAAEAAPGAQPGHALAKRQRVTGTISDRRREVARALVPAVEIDLPGCSYNPDKEQHQDAIAVAVAAEMQKLYNKDLEPVAPPQLVDYQPEQDELEGLLHSGDEAASDEEGRGQQEEGEPGTGGEDAAAARQRKALERKTRKERNRDKRRREEEEALAERKRLKAQRRDLDRLQQLESEVEARLREQEQARLRKQLDREERLAGQAPKLGKQRFEAAPLQVLTTDEVSGSLRLLKPTVMLAKDRFKSLQKRGMIEPRRKVAKKAGRKVLYEQGARWDKEKEGQQAIDEARQRLKKQKKKKAASEK
ncbi:hypothetical protein N2152v2_003750 [Parachlorella kessleri]